MSTWSELLFGNLVGFGAVMVITFTVLIAVFFVVAYLKLTRIAPPDTDSHSSNESTAENTDDSRKAA